MNSAVGQLKVCVPSFKVNIFCVAKGKYSKPQKIILLVELYEEERGCGHVWMCSEVSLLRQRRLCNAVEKAGTTEKLQYEYSGNTGHTYFTSAYTVQYAVVKFLSVFIIFFIHCSNIQGGF